MVLVKVKKKNDNIRKSRPSLTQKVVNGGFWIFSLRVGSRILNFIRTIILARLLSPHDFGLMGIKIDKGQHTIELNYFSPLLIPGVIISIFFIILYITLIFNKRRLSIS